MSDRLGTAQWEEQALVSQRYPFEQGKVWLGRAEDRTPIGYRDDRHICLVSGTRGGKGTSILINNLCFWPGSAVVVDPKGENATVTAARRGQGSEYCEGMGQAVHVLDPFRAAQVDESYRSSFNPLDVLDPERDESIDEASRIANAIVVVKDDAREPFWDESARGMLRGLILYVLTAPHFGDDERNLITVRNLILRGEWQIFEGLRDDGFAEETIDPPHLLLWRNMERNPAFDGLVAGIGRRFRDMMKSADKTFDGILQSVAQHTEFLDSPGMRKALVKSDFKLSELKTRPEGMTLYLSLPQRYMDTHYRWLRMMVALTTTEMEITRGQPATGHPVLMVLDEFAGLKRMSAIESGVAQLAGFGVKLLFVLQSLEQLKHTYKDSWETFLSNAGLKIFFGIEDHFTREYISKLAGETEIIRELRSVNESRSQGRSESESYSEGRSESQSVSQSATTGSSSSQSLGTSESAGWSQGSSYGISYQKYKFLFFKEKPGPATFSEGQNRSTSGSRGSSHSDTYGHSTSETGGTSETTGTSQTHSRSTSTNASTSAGSGTSESLHRRPLIQPDELGRAFARIDDKNHPGYPGLALVIVTGSNPLVVWRRNYFEDVQFINCFSPHPDHKFLPISRPSVPFDAAKFHKLIEDYWLDKTTVEQTQPLLRAAFEEFTRGANEFCAKIEKPDWKKEAKEECDSIPHKITDIFSVALYIKKGEIVDEFRFPPEFNTLERYHQGIEYVAGKAEAAYYKSRGVGLTLTVGPEWKQNLEELMNLVPRMRHGRPFPPLRSHFPVAFLSDWREPVYAFKAPLPSPPPVAQKPAPMWLWHVLGILLGLLAIYLIFQSGILH